VINYCILHNPLEKQDKKHSPTLRMIPRGLLSAWITGNPHTTRSLINPFSCTGEHVEIKWSGELGYPPGGKCPGGKSLGGKCPGVNCPVGELSCGGIVQGVNVLGEEVRGECPRTRDPELNILTTQPRCIRVSSSCNAPNWRDIES
jgi:hypothetical protein